MAFVAPPPSDAERSELAPRSGLCAACRHLQVLRSRRGTVFVRCGLSDRDAAMARYPPLPVRGCRGFEDTAASKTQRVVDTPRRPL